MNFNENKDWQRMKQQSGLSDGQFDNLWKAAGTYKSGYQADWEKGFASFQSKMPDQATGGKVVPMRSQRSILLKIAAGVLVLAVAALAIKSQMTGGQDLKTISNSGNSKLDYSLPDGSSIALNRSASISYPSEFGGAVRQVELSGEAFFDVKRNETKPFVIETEAARVTVLGTSFNVRANPGDDFIEVFVVSGKVRVEVKETGELQELTKGQYLRIDKKSAKLISGNDEIGIPSAWHTGRLSFREQPIPKVLEGLERLYGVKINLKTSQPTSCLQTLTVEKGDLKAAIQALEVSCPNLKFKENSPGIYTVNGQCCR